MNSAINEVLNNTILISAIIAWLLAQFIKFGLGIILEGKADITKLTGSGGMPSGHAAVVSAVALGVGRLEGLASTEFALAAVISLIVMYDAAGVRQAVGNQAQTLNDIIHDIYQGSGITQNKVREILGHTPYEVIAGAFLGIIVSMLI